MHYVVSDHLGSPSLILDKDGNVEQKIDYLSYGQERMNEILNPSPFPNTTPPTPFGFTGQRKNNDGSGLLNYKARFYHPALMRFIQPDPAIVDTTRPEFKHAMENPQLLNPYSYVANNPVKYIDPTGEYLLFPQRRATSDIKNNRSYIIDAANKYKDVTQEMVGAVIYQERYGRQNVNIFDMADVPLGILGVDTSIGLGQVKKSTAIGLGKQGYAPSLDSYKFSFAGIDVTGLFTDSMKITKVLSDPKENTKYVAGYLQYQIDKWKEEYPNIVNDIGVLSTLYNLPEKKPHSNPKASPNYGEKVEKNFNYVKSLLKK